MYPLYVTNAGLLFPAEFDSQTKLCRGKKYTPVSVSPPRSTHCRRIRMSFGGDLLVSETSEVLTLASNDTVSVFKTVDKLSVGDRIPYTVVSLGCCSSTRIEFHNSGRFEGVTLTTDLAVLLGLLSSPSSQFGGGGGKTIVVSLCDSGPSPPSRISSLLETLGVIHDLSPKQQQDENTPSRSVVFEIKDEEFYDWLSLNDLIQSGCVPKTIRCSDVHILASYVSGLTCHSKHSGRLTVSVPKFTHCMFLSNVAGICRSLGYGVSIEENMLHINPDILSDNTYVDGDTLYFVDRISDVSHSRFQENIQVVRAPGSSGEELCVMNGYIFKIPI